MRLLYGSIIATTNLIVLLLVPINVPAISRLYEYLQTMCEKTY